MSGVGNYTAGSPEAMALDANPTGSVTIGGNTFGPVFQRPVTPQARPPGQPDGELLIVGDGQTLGGWQAVSVTCGVMRMPRDFSVSATARLPSEQRAPIENGAQITVLIGGHVVLTGYLERVNATISPEQHSVALSGRGLCCDLVDCSAIIPGSNGLNVTSIGELARTLVKPFAGPIYVLTPDGDGDAKAYQLQINLSESPYEMLERVARYEGLLAYEDAGGNLVLSRVGTKQHTSGFTEGLNIQAAEYLQTLDERFSVYIPQLMSSEFMAGRADSSLDKFQTATDPGVNRYRPRIVISEQAGSGGIGFLAEQRAAWEMLHRYGQSQRIVLTCDSWLDSSGLPWSPNMLAPVSIPSLDFEDIWIITEVTYRRDAATGTTAQVTLMPPQALTVEPEGLQSTLATRLQDPAPGPIGTPTPAVAPTTAPNAGPDFNPRAGDGPGI